MRLRLILLSFLFLGFACKKEKAQIPLATTLVGGWFAQSVTQSGIDVTAAYQYHITFEMDGNSVVQRIWSGVYTAFQCTYTIDEDTDQLHIAFTGAQPWEINWELTEADIGSGKLKFRDLDASAETLIELWKL